jgi:alpha/beta superfamily hydrolase
MKTKRLHLKNAQGEKLSARLDLPEQDKPRAYALFAHCFTCSKDHKAPVYISKALTQSGIAVLRFDFTGLGESGGEFTETNFTSNVQDLLCAAEFLRENYQAPALLMGHSLGGTAVLKAALKIPSAKAVVTIATPFDPAHVLTHFDVEEIEQKGEAEVELIGNKVKITKQFIDDVKQHSIEEDLQRLNTALLVMHAPLDKIVSIENATFIFRAARHPKSFISLDDADHLLTSRKDAAYVGSLIAVWAKKYCS